MKTSIATLGHRDQPLLPRPHRLGGLPGLQGPPWDGLDGGHLSCRPSHAVAAVKSAQHLAAGVGPARDRILYVAAPGTASPDFAAPRLPGAGRPLWPQVADPFAQPNP